jgi:hypothetical protein
MRSEPGHFQEARPAIGYLDQHAVRQDILSFGDNLTAVALVKSTRGRIVP